MEIAIWVATGVLAFAFLGGGFVKAFASRKQQKELGLLFVDDFSENTIRLIGGLELLAVIGLIVPALVDIGTILVPLAASGLVLVMIGAAYVHYRRGEMKDLPKNIGLLVAALFVAVMRFGPNAL